MLATTLGLSNPIAMWRARPRRPARYSVKARFDQIPARSDLERLLPGGAATVFQSPEWVRSFGRTIAAARGCKAFHIEVRDNRTGRLVMVLPLLLRETRGLKLIEFPDFGLADYGAPLVAEGFVPSRRAMNRIWAQIRASLPSADLVRFVKQPGVISGRPNPLVRLAGTMYSTETSWGVPLSCPRSAWSDAFTCEKRRADIDARWRKLNKRGVVEFRTATSEEEADVFFSALVSQRAARFATLNYPNALEKPEIRAFYRALLRPADPQSPAVIQALLIDGEIIATGYGFVGNQAFHMIFPTFQADVWRNYSPGLHLFRKSMEWAAGQGLTYYDFTIGAEGFKRDFGAREQALHERYEALSFAGLVPLGLVALRRLVKQQPRLATLLSAVKSRFKAGGR